MDKKIIAIAELLYMGYDPYTDQDCDVRNKSVIIVKTRKEHHCFTGNHTIKIGEKARFEKAIVDGEWGSYYGCLKCINKELDGEK